MKNIILILSCLAFLSFKIENNDKDSISKSLIGIWVQSQDNDKTSYLYVRSNELIKNSRALIFNENGTVTIYEEFGCQMPPNFTSEIANWEVKTKHKVLIEKQFPSQKPIRMKIVKLNENILRFEWKL